MFERAHKLAQSDYGREFGWLIEHDGAVVGELTDPVFVDQYWFAYRLTPTSERGKTLLLQPALWDKCVFRFKNRILHEYAENAFSGGTTEESLRNGRITMRALYLVPNGKLEEFICNWAVQKEKRKRKTEHNSQPYR